MEDMFDLEEIYEDSEFDEMDEMDLDAEYESVDDDWILEDINSNNVNLSYDRGAHVPDHLKPKKARPYDQSEPKITGSKEIDAETYNYVIGRLHKSMNEAAKISGYLQNVVVTNPDDFVEAHTASGDLDDLDLDTNTYSEYMDDEEI